MKKIICLILSAILLLCFAGCGNNENTKTNESTVSQKNSTTKIDVDLSELSSTVVYSQVYNITAEPEKYIGQTFKMKGKLAVSDFGGKTYFACLFDDATACCSLNIEFTPKETYKYPDDFPELGSEITVIGTFRTYTEGESVYCDLFDADIV